MMAKFDERAAVAIVVLNWNRAGDIAECLEGVFANTYPDFQVILVDNASADDSIDVVRAWAEGRIKVESEFIGGTTVSKPVAWQQIEIDRALAADRDRLEQIPGIRTAPPLTIVASSSNLGYAAGHNLGISIGLMRGASYILLLNSDIMVDREFLTHLVSEADSAGAGAAGPVVLDYFKPGVVCQAGARVSPGRGWVQSLGRGAHMDTVGHAPREVDSLMGCAILLRAEAVRQVGLIDPDYFVYLEESDWMVRAGCKGWKVLLVPEAKVWHKETALGRQLKSVYSAYYFARNRLMLVRKNYPHLLPQAAAWSLRYGILNNVYRRRWAGLRMSLLGMWDFVRGRKGKREFSGGTTGLPGVVVFSTDYKPGTGGISEHAHRVALGFHRLGAPVTVLAPRLPQSEIFDSGQPFKTLRVPQVPVLDWLLYAAHIFRLVASGRVGFVYCATSHPCGLICVMLKVMVSFSFTVTIHAHEVIYSSANLRQRVKKALKCVQIGVFSRARRVFAVSSFTRDGLVDAGVAAEKVVTVFNGVAIDELLQLPSNPRITREMGLEGRRVLLTVARLDVHKGHDVVIRAMPRILKQVPEAVYVIAGEGVMKPRLEALVAETKVEDHVIFAGQLPRSDILALFGACEVFVLNSRAEAGNAEGFGIVLLEAAVFRKPTVGGRSGGIPDAVEDGVTGLLVDPENPDEVAGVVVRILTEPDLAARLGEAGHARVRSSFTWDRVLERIIDSLE